MESFLTLFMQKDNALTTSLHNLLAMSTDDKIKYGMMAVTGASVVFVTLGVHAPLAITNGLGVG